MTFSTILDLQPGSNQPVSAPTLPPQWQEQLAQLMEQDRKFFLQHPEQEYYIRPIAPVEIVEAEAVGRTVTPEDSVLVGEVAPGFRVRLPAGDGQGQGAVKKFKAAQQQIRREIGVKSSGWLSNRLKRRSQAQKRPKPQGFG